MKDSRGYKHICPVCEEDFHGRLNRKYCSDECKSFHNNNLARTRFIGVASDIVLYKEAFELLESLIGRKGKIEIPLSELKGRLNPRTPVSRIKVDNSETLWARIGNLAFSYTNDKTIKIVNLNN